MSARSLPYLLGGAIMVSLLTVPAPASAHTGLTTSSPGDGARLDVMPKQVVLELSDPVAEPAYVVVADSAGRRVNSKVVRIDGKKVSSAIVEPAPAGAYLLSFRVVSADAHVITDTVRFSVTGSRA